MTPVRYIRTKVFGLTQAEFAKIAKTSQPQISRLEKGNRHLNTKQCGWIRAAAKRLGLPWQDSWFFAVPPAKAGRARTAARKRERGLTAEAA